MKTAMMVVALACSGLFIGCGGSGGGSESVSRVGYEKLLNQMEYSAQEKQRMLQDFDKADEDARKVMYGSVKAGVEMMKKLK